VNTLDKDAFKVRELNSGNYTKVGDPCAKCGRSEPEVEFGKRRNSYGKYYRWNRCKECHTAIQRSRDKAARNKWGYSTNAIRDNKPPEGTPCDCCGKPMTHKGKNAMHFDHDPKTNIFRGWLCKQCNTGIGLLGDDLEGLKTGIAYLERHESNLLQGGK